MDYQVDYYKILGITKKATKTEIKVAYRKLAMLHHPDRNLDDPDAEIRFKQISEAYSILSNGFKRTDYDYSYSRFHENKDNTANSKEKDSNTKEAFSKSQQNHEKNNKQNEEKHSSYYRQEERYDESKSYSKNHEEYYEQPNIYIVHLNFWESVIGCEKQIEIIINKKKHYITYQFPPGVLDKQQYFISILEEKIYLQVHIEPNKFYLRDNLDVYIHIEIPLSKAILGGTLNIPHWYMDKCVLNIPPGTQNGDKLSIFNAGIKRDMFIGDLYVIVNIKIPKKLTEKQKIAIQMFAEVENETPTIFESFKNSWSKFIKK